MIVETDFQCKRCGSSLSIERCEQCDGTGTDGHECGEDCCSCADPVDNVPCSICDGAGFYGFCLSSKDWCEANPLDGRADVDRHTPEEFAIP